MLLYEALTACKYHTLDITYHKQYQLAIKVFVYIADIHQTYQKQVVLQSEF